MWATGMMSPDWWKEAAISHKWYRDDLAFADHSLNNSPLGPGINCLAVFYNGAKAEFPILFGKTKSEEGGAASFNNNGEPFELMLTGPVGLKDQNGTVKYLINGIVYENDTLKFTFKDSLTNTENEVIMGIAPEGFTTDLFSNVNAAPPAEPVVNTVPSAPAQIAPWNCACGTTNNGKYCTSCGAKNPNI